MWLFNILLGLYAVRTRGLGTNSRIDVISMAKVENWELRAGSMNDALHRSND